MAQTSTVTRESARKMNYILFWIWGALVGMLIMLACIHQGWTGDYYHLPPCPMEDSDNCIWNAQVLGNHVGQSFVVIDGEYYYHVGE